MLLAIPVALFDGHIGTTLKTEPGMIKSPNFLDMFELTANDDSEFVIIDGGSTRYDSRTDGTEAKQDDE